MRREAVVLALRPAARVAAEPGGLWRATEARPRFELVVPAGGIPSGWVLLRGRLDRRGGGHVACLHASGADGDRTFELPVTLKGTLLELVELPPRTVRLELEFVQEAGVFGLGPFSLKRVDRLECLWRMVRRVAPVYCRQPRERRRPAGLGLGTAFLHLGQAYRLAGRFRSGAPVIPYDRWIRDCEALTPAELDAIRADVDRRALGVRFRLVATGGGDGLAATRASLAAQLYPGLDREAADLRAALAGPEPETTWVVPVRPGVRLAPHALYWLACAAAADRRLRLIYTDHDCLDDGGGRCRPVFKPDWSPELLRATDYIGPAAAFRADLLAGLAAGREATAAGDGHDLLLRAAEVLAAAAVGHIPAVLFHLPPEASCGPPVRSGSGPVADHLARLGIAATVATDSRGHCRLRYALPGPPPLVSILVATRDGGAVLARCLDSLRAKTTYPRYELVVVDNQSADPDSCAYLRRLAGQPGVTVLAYDRPFNFAAINNLAAARARGELLCLLNNDTEVISPDWLEEMAGRLLQPGVGAVGAKLYFGDGRVQHGGDVVGPGGCANHLHACLGPDDPGYCDRAVLAQELSAVTAACLLTRRDLYLHLGGLDARHLPVAFNDVDYCLRLGEAGLRVIWTPYAALYHHESTTRGADDTPEKRRRARREVRYMRRRWRRVMRHDPYYNPNLSYARPDFSLNPAPLVKKPWQD